MRKSPLFLVAGLLLAVGASLPGKDGARLPYDPAVGVGGPYEPVETVAVVSSGYPPCSRTVTDRCIQLNERAVRAALQRQAPRPAMGGPIEGTAAYPHCSRLITDECVQLFDRDRRPVSTRRPVRRAPDPAREANTPGI